MITLNDDRQIPQLGFGTYKIDDEAAPNAVGIALDVGYQLVDTGSIYENERGVGKALQDRGDVWLTTKIWNSDQGYEEAKTAFGHALNRLGREDVDLLLIHWPCPDKQLYLETWKAFIELREEGRAKSIGVSNFEETQLRELVDATGFAPAVNQVELHPRFQQRELRQVHEELGIATQSWSPLGRADYFDDPAIASIAEETGQSPAAIIIRWHLQHGLLTIPKASSRGHIEDNFAATTFELSDEQMARIDALDDEGGRMGPHPANFC
nr:aldo/keto reductase [Sphingomicrobium sediminis]